MIYAAASGWPAAVVRGTLQAVFFAITIFQLGLFATTGVLRLEHVRQFGWAVPGIVVGVALGALVARRIAERTFRWVLFSLLLVLGARFVVKALA